MNVFLFSYSDNIERLMYTTMLDSIGVTYSAQRFADEKKATILHAINNSVKNSTHFALMVTYKYDYLKDLSNY